jgi:hypothetical protein
MTSRGIAASSDPAYRPAVVGLNEEVGHRLRRLRETHKAGGNDGFSLRKWADYLGDQGHGIDWNTVRKYEVGMHRVPVDYLMMVARVTDTDPLWILTGEGRIS